MTIEKQSFCKVNLLLNILERRADGFHELETVMHPIQVHDKLTLSRSASGIELVCNHPTLPVDHGNLVYRAAQLFLETTGIKDGVRIELEKHIPMAAGLGGGSGNAAATLSGLNDIFEAPLSRDRLSELAASLGSDIPFFLQDQPALATGRGEKVEALAPFPALQGAWFLLVNPGFGISTAWAYRSLARFPAALNGQPGRGRHLVKLLNGNDLTKAGSAFYNSLEAPALEKFPLLVLLKKSLKNQGATVSLMSGSGSTVFGIFPEQKAAEDAAVETAKAFGGCWTSAVAVG
jgi:4-diphosphocytidyl-2-C-methyl-D-erythritol kinase